MTSNHQTPKKIVETKGTYCIYVLIMMTRGGEGGVGGPGDKLNEICPAVEDTWDDLTSKAKL